MSQETYFAGDTPFAAERQRLAILERLFDEVTREGLIRLGVREGWRCCEIGAGGGSMTRWLAQVVGPTGRVVAVDLDTRFLADLHHANVEVIQGDFRSEARTGEPFDLVFTRFVLMHLADSQRGVDRMAQLTKPNGWVFAIDCDLGNLSAADPDHPKAHEFDLILQKQAAYDYAHYKVGGRTGRRLSKLFEEAGLVDVSDSAWTSVARGGSLQAEFWRRTWEVAAPGMMADGSISPEEHDLYLSTMADPSFRFVDALYFRASGRKPPM